MTSWLRPIVVVVVVVVVVVKEEGGVVWGREVKPERMSEARGGLLESGSMVRRGAHTKRHEKTASFFLFCFAFFSSASNAFANTSGTLAFNG